MTYDESESRDFGHGNSFEKLKLSAKKMEFHTGTSCLHLEQGPKRGSIFNIQASLDFFSTFLNIIILYKKVQPPEEKHGLGHVMCE